MITVEHIRNGYTPEMALIIYICRLHFKNATAIEVNSFIDKSVIDWELFKKIIKAHQIRPFINNCISKYDINIEASVKEKLREDCLKIAKENLSKLAELVRLNKIFNQQGVTVVFYKGVILSNALFNDFISRETADIDFIIQPEDFAKLYDIFIQEGYTTPYYYNPRYEKYFLVTDNELLFQKETSGVKYNIEMHWAVTHSMMDIPLRNQALFSGIDKIKLLGEDVNVFTMQNHLLLLLVHHGVNDIWRTLRHNLDMSLLTQRYGHQLNWEQIDAVTKANKLNKTTAIGFFLSNTLFGTPIPGVFSRHGLKTDRVLNNLLRFPAIRRKKLSLENIVQQFRLRDSAKDRTSLLLSYINAALMPNMRDIEAVHIPPRFYILYYFIKPFRLLLRRNGE